MCWTYTPDFGPLKKMLWKFPVFLTAQPPSAEALPGDSGAPLAARGRPDEDGLVRPPRLRKCLFDRFLAQTLAFFTQIRVSEGVPPAKSHCWQLI